MNETTTGRVKAIPAARSDGRQGHNAAPPARRGDDVVAQRVVAILREPDPIVRLNTALVLADSGMRVLEITTTGGHAADTIAELAVRRPSCTVGAGTVTTAAEAIECLDAGARFLVAPYVVPDIADYAHDSGATVLFGAVTPAEVQHALNAGADLVKLFPAGPLTTRWLTQLRAVFPHVRFVPTGGITPDATAEWLEAGAAACGLGSNLATGTPADIQRRVTHLLDRLEPSRYRPT